MLSFYRAICAPCSPFATCGGAFNSSPATSQNSLNTAGGSALAMIVLRLPDLSQVYKQ